MLFLFLNLLSTTLDTTYNLNDFRLSDAGASDWYLKAYVSLPWDELHRIDDSLDFQRIIKVAYFNLYLPWRIERLNEKSFLELRVTPRSTGSYRLWLDDYSGTVDSVYYRINPDFSAGISTTVNTGFYIGSSCFYVGSIDTVSLSYSIYKRSETYNVQRSEAGAISGSVYVGPGIGKTRSVTPAVHAWEFLDELNQASYENISALADLFSRRWQYRYKYWRHEKFFYQDVEKLLMDRDVIIDLDAYSLMRMKEIIETVQPGRYSGTRLWMGLGGNGRFVDYKLTDTAYVDTYFDKGIQLFLDGGYPISRRWQLSWFAQADLKTEDFQRWQNHQEWSADIGYYISDRFKISLGTEGRRWDESQTTPKWVRPPDPPGWHIDYIILPCKGWSCSIPLRTEFYLDNSLFVYGQVIGYSGHYEYPHYDESISSNQGIYFDAGLTWRLF